MKPSDLILSIRPNFKLSLTSSTMMLVPPALRAKVMARDRYTCVYCGFRAKRFQEVHSADIDNVVASNRPNDWVTVCHMCEQCLSLDRVGMMGEGILIWLPEIQQTELNHLMRALYVARQSESEIADAAKKGLDALRARREDSKRRMGTDDPMILATIFADTLKKEEYDQRVEKLKDIRLLSLDRRIQKTKTGDVDRFSDMVAYWASSDTQLGETPVGEWKGLLAKIK